MGDKCWELIKSGRIQTASKCSGKSVLRGSVFLDRHSRSRPLQFEFHECTLIITIGNGPENVYREVFSGLTIAWISRDPPTYQHIRTLTYSIGFRWPDWWRTFERLTGKLLMYRSCSPFVWDNCLRRTATPSPAFRANGWRGSIDLAGMRDVSHELLYLDVQSSKQQAQVVRRPTGSGEEKTREKFSLRIGLTDGPVHTDKNAHTQKRTHTHIYIYTHTSVPVSCTLITFDFIISQPRPIC